MKKISVGRSSVILIFILSACLNTIPTASTSTVAPTPTPVLIGRYEVFQPEELRADVDELFKVLEALHPNPYLKRSKQDVDLARRQLSAELSQPMTDIAFYKKIAPLLNSLGDYHTNILPSDATFEVILANEVLLPFEMQVEDGHVYIIENDSDEGNIPYGTELLAVNDVPAITLDHEAHQLWPIGRYLDPLGIWFVLGSSHEYQVKLTPAGQTDTVVLTVAGLTYQEILSKKAKDPSGEDVQYETLPGEKIGLLAVNSFDRITPALKRALLQIRKDEVEHLILDLRANHGGSIVQAETTLGYFLHQPYRLCSRSFIAPFNGYGSAAPTETECEQKYPLNIPQKYEGKLYVLTGPDTVSAGVLVATVLQDYKAATLIGEESDTPASMCGAVLSERGALTNTRLQYNYSRTCMIRPNGKLDDRGILPDILVTTTIEDQIKGNDPVLNYVLEMIHTGEPTP